MNYSALTFEFATADDCLDKMVPSDLRRLIAERDALREWRNVVIDALVIGHILTKEHEDDPRKALHDLICWEIQIALDPAVSEEACKLIKSGS